MSDILTNRLCVRGQRVIDILTNREKRDNTGTRMNTYVSWRSAVFRTPTVAVCQRTKRDRYFDQQREERQRETGTWNTLSLI